MSEPSSSSDGPDSYKVELDDAGYSSGIEAEQIEFSEEITEPFDPRLIDVTTETRTLDSLMKRLALGQIDLDPDFQRSRGIWTDSKKSLLIESLLLRIPLPTFYVAETDDGEASELGAGRWAVVDGIQRLSTIAEFVQPSKMGQRPLRLTSIEYLKGERNKTFEELSPALQLRVLESQFTIQVIRRSTPSPVQLNIFARINTGGVPLSAQELRHALTPGPARGYLRELAESLAFKRAVDNSVSPSRMADREMVLRFISFLSTDPSSYAQQDFNRFLRDSMQEINNWPHEHRKRIADEFEFAMFISFEIFGKDAFRKRYDPEDTRRPVSKALFESVAVAIALVQREGGRTAVEKLIEASVSVRQEFIDSMQDIDFDRAISQGTGDPVRVRERFEKMLQLMRNHAS